MMEFVPWKTFSRIVVRYGGDSRVRRLSCGEIPGHGVCHLTYRESLRDIEIPPVGPGVKAISHGFSEPVGRSTLADANEVRDWRIHAELAQRLIDQARRRIPGKILVRT
jgi:hypothetical protein